MNKLRVAGFVLGIVGCALFLVFLLIFLETPFATEDDFVNYTLGIWFGPLGCSVIGFIFTRIAQKQMHTRLSNAGFALALTGMISNGVLFIVSFIEFIL